MNVLVRMALLLCPAEFRREHRDRIAADVEGAGSVSPRLLAICVDIAIAGVAMRGENLVRDVVFSFRTLVRAPLFTAVAGGAIALAIGANVAVSSVLFGVALKPLPFPDAGRLAFVSTGTTSYGRLSAYDATAIRASRQSFGAFALARETSETYTGSGATPVALTGRLIDGSYFDVLGARAQLGRLLDASDIGTRHMVVSFDIWERLFSADPAIVAKHLRFGPHDYVVIGVAAPLQDPAPYGLTTPAFWIPVDTHSPMWFSRVWRAFYALARLAPAATPASAQADATNVLRTLARSDPRDFVGIREATVQPVFAAIVGPSETLLWTLYAAVAVVLLIACANVANLNLVRAAKRDRELRIRAAVGATRARIVGQLITEALLLAVFGGLAGLGVGAALLALFRHYAARQLPRFENVAIDPAIVLYTVVLMVVCTLFIGVLPAIAQRKRALAVRSGEPRNANRVRTMLVVTEIALALAVVMNAGLIVRSYIALTHVPLGFDARDTYVVDFVIPPTFTPPVLATFLQTSVKALHAIPGTVAVSAAGPVPFVFDYFVQTFSFPGRNARYTTNKHSIGPEYFTALGIPLMRGRAFGKRDVATARPVAIVNARFAQHYFGSLDAVGRRIVFQSFTNEPSVASTIVGVSGDARNAFYSPPEPEIYVPAAQSLSFGRYVIRMHGASAGLGASVSRALRGIEPLIPPPVVTSYDELLARNADQSRAATLLFGALGTIALFLAIAGVFAVTSYSVEQRTREFGIRKAVGARSDDLLRRVLRSAVMQSCVGIALGLLAAALSAGLLGSLLFQTSPFDPLTLGAVVALLIVSTVLAACAPALRATAVDPVVALRYE